MTKYSDQRIEQFFKEFTENFRQNKDRIVDQGERIYMEKLYSVMEKLLIFIDTFIRKNIYCFGNKTPFKGFFVVQHNKVFYVDNIFFVKDRTCGFPILNDCSKLLVDVQYEHQHKGLNNEIKFIENENVFIGDDSIFIGKTYKDNIIKLIVNYLELCGMLEKMDPDEYRDYKRRNKTIRFHSK